ncbi:hypothetical protein K7A41_09420 [Sphingobacterium sp. InxBP1]|uniref:hypothetical protein n=1 Tax=Sphingobacterium sp. InxBP1 TaxID=2870328 RepID=UPI0022437ABF|nr:hypothetical protein [Sphingobacterium sp. InxBP1]MCW8311442.1 hypothetical protein [Sphingobacterium sp. InxBP1]
MLTLLILKGKIMTIDDIPVTDIPLNWRDLKKKGRSGRLLSTLRNLPVGKAIEVSSYGTVKVYVSKLNKEFVDREYNHFRNNGSYFIGRTA